MIVNSNCISFALSGSEVEVKFVDSFSYMWVENLGSSTIKISRSPNIESQDSGVIQRPPKSSVGMQVTDSTIYISGDSGTINVMGTNSAENPFKITGEGGGGNAIGGVTDYNDLQNRPKINGITLTGDSSFSDLGLKPMTEDEMTEMINRIKGVNYYAK